MNMPVRHKSPKSAAVLQRMVWGVAEAVPEPGGYIPT